MTVVEDLRQPEGDVDQRERLCLLLPRSPQKVAWISFLAVSRVPWSWISLALNSCSGKPTSFAWIRKNSSRSLLSSTLALAPWE